MDNIRVSGNDDSTFYVATFPKLGGVLSGGVVGSRIFELNAKTQQVKPIFSDDGNQFNFITVASKWKDQLVLAGLSGDYVGICTIT